MTLRACLDCGTPAAGRRCPTHQGRVDERKALVTRRHYGPGWTRLSQETIAAHVAAHGWMCLGWGRPAHPSRSLTADHRIPIATGGSSVAANLGVLCRSCNSRKGAR